MHLQPNRNALERIEVSAFIQVGGQIQSIERKPVIEFFPINLISFIFEKRSRSDEKRHVFQQGMFFRKIRFECFCRNLLTIHVQGEKIQAVVFEIEGVLVIGAVECTRRHTAESDAFWQLT